MTYLESIENAIDKVDEYKDSFYFHNIVTGLAALLGFVHAKEWYEAEPTLPPFFKSRVFEFSSLKALKPLLDHRVLFNYFVHKKKYIKGNDFMTASTLHQSNLDLILRQYSLAAIASNSTLGLDLEMNYEIVTPDEVNQRFPPDGERPALRRAFDNRCLIQKDNHYLMHPGCLFELIKRNNLFP